jgi:hypothetical protein
LDDVDLNPWTSRRTVDSKSVKNLREGSMTMVDEVSSDEDGVVVVVVVVAASRKRIGCSADDVVASDEDEAEVKSPALARARRARLDGATMAKEGRKVVGGSDDLKATQPGKVVAAVAAPPAATGYTFDSFVWVMSHCEGK